MSELFPKVTSDEIDHEQSLEDAKRDAIARVYDAKGNQVKSVALTTKLPVVQAGRNAAMFDCEFRGDTPPRVTVTFKTMGQPARVR